MVKQLVAIVLTLYLCQEANVLNLKLMMKLSYYYIHNINEGFPDRVIPGAMRGCVNDSF